MNVSRYAKNFDFERYWFWIFRKIGREETYKEIASRSDYLYNLYLQNCKEERVGNIFENSRTRRRIEGL